MGQGLFSAVTGIQANQTMLNVVSNNIANVNTLGFKSSNADFETVFSNTISGGSAPNGTLGGTNPEQLGSGALVSEIASNFNQGGTQYTGRNTDLMINGNGFFVVGRNDLNNGNSSTAYFLTRAGNFSLDSNGDLVTSSGNPVIGTSLVSGNATANLGKVQIPTQFTITKDVDAAGHVLAVHLSPLNTPPATIAAAMNAGAVSQNTVNVQLQSFSIGSNGAIAATYNNGDVITTRVNQASVAANPTDPTQWTTELAIEPSEGGTYGAVNLAATDSGMLDETGPTAVFDGGVGLPLGGGGIDGRQLQLQLASVTNPQGLLYDGSNNFLTGPNSGTVQFGSASTGSRGSIDAGALETSNVNMANEFTNMIVAQRGLEAASKVVSTQSQVMQTIIQMVQ